MEMLTVEDYEVEAIEPDEYDEAAIQEVEDNNVGFWKKQFEINRAHREEQTIIFEECDRAKRGHYEPDDLAAIRTQGGSEVFMMLFAAKATALESWLADIFAPRKDKIFGVEATPVPELPREVIERAITLVQQEVMAAQQQGIQPTPAQIQSRERKIFSELQEALNVAAGKAAEEMETLIADRLESANFQEALASFLVDVTTFPGAIMKTIQQPVRKSRYAGGEFVIEEVFENQDVRVSPYDAYPSPGAKTVDEGSFIEVVSYSKKDLYDCSKNPEYNREVIREILEETGQYGDHWLWRDGLDQDGDQLHDHDDGLIDGLHCWGDRPGQDLIDDGMPEFLIEDPLKMYSIETIIVKDKTILLRLNNDPLGKRPYRKACLYPIPGSFWGTPLYYKMRDIQRVCNTTARGLMNNLSMSSGPMVEVEVERLADDAEVGDLHAWKQFQVKSDPSGKGQKAIRFFQPDSNAGELMAVYEKFWAQATELTMIPSFSQDYGRRVGAMETAEGFAQWMDTLTKGIKNAARIIDKDVIKPRIEAEFYTVMTNNPSAAVIGDAQIVARGASALLQKGQTAARRNQFLNIVTKSSILQRIMGHSGIAAVVRPMLEDLGADEARVLPDDEELRQKEAEDRQAAQKKTSGPDPRLQMQMHQDKMTVEQMKIADKEKDRLLKQAEMHGKGIIADANLRSKDADRKLKETLQAREIAVKNTHGQGL